MTFSGEYYHHQRPAFVLSIIYVTGSLMTNNRSWFLLSEKRKSLEGWRRSYSYYGSVLPHSLVGTQSHCYKPQRATPPHFFPQTSRQENHSISQDCHVLVGNLLKGRAWGGKYLVFMTFSLMSSNPFHLLWWKAHPFLTEAGHI